MRSLSIGTFLSGLLAVVVLVTSTACSGSDPAARTGEGYAALGKGDNAGALSKFESALSGLDLQHPEYLRAALGRCQALAHVDPARARSTFLDLAKAMPAKIGEDDYSLICNELLQSGATLDAIDVMKAGHDRFPTSPKMEAMVSAVKSAAAREKTPEAMNKLAGLGYAGG
jgi:hypothetical protein